MVDIVIPSRLELEPSIDFANRLKLEPYADEFRFLFNLHWVEPFGLLFVSQAICDLQKQYPSSRFSAQVNQYGNASPYAAWMGFYKACNIDYGNNPGDAPGSSTYIPVIFQSVSDLIGNAEHVGLRIQSIARDLAQRLVRQQSGSLVNIVEYSFREIIRNVAEHSQSQTIGFCAQFWSSGPNRGIVEIAIIDHGVGLRSTLSKNPFLNIVCDEDALKYALAPGISGKVYKGVELRKNDPWQNSGYGLYMNYRLCNEGGSFYIGSGSKGLFRYKGAEDNRYFTTNIQGTVLRLRLAIQNLRNPEDLLARFTHEGESLSQKIMEGAIPNASRMSTLIREDFRSLAPSIEIGNRVKHAQFNIGTVIKIILNNQGRFAAVLFDNGRSKTVPTHALIKLDDLTGNNNLPEDLPF